MAVPGDNNLSCEICLEREPSGYWTFTSLDILEKLVGRNDFAFLGRWGVGAIKATYEAGPANPNKVRPRIGKVLPGLATVCKY